MNGLIGLFIQRASYPSFRQFGIGLGVVVLNYPLLLITDVAINNLWRNPGSEGAKYRLAACGKFLARAIIITGINAAGYKVGVLRVKSSVLSLSVAISFIFHFVVMKTYQASTFPTITKGNPGTSPGQPSSLSSPKTGSGSEPLTPPSNLTPKVPDLTNSQGKLGSEDDSSSDSENDETPTPSLTLTPEVPESPVDSESELSLDSSSDSENDENPEITESGVGSKITITQDPNNMDTANEMIATESHLDVEEPRGQPSPIPQEVINPESDTNPSKREAIHKKGSKVPNSNTPIDDNLSVQLNDKEPLMDMYAKRKKTFPEPEEKNQPETETFGAHKPVLESFATAINEDTEINSKGTNNNPTSPISGTETEPKGVNNRPYRSKGGKRTENKSETK